jgi:hypothetical protein
MRFIFGFPEVDINFLLENIELSYSCLSVSAAVGIDRLYFHNIMTIRDTLIIFTIVTSVPFMNFGEIVFL